jgi:hypothetical protein
MVSYVLATLGKNMQSTNIELRYDTVQKIHDVIPFVRTDEDMYWVADWVIIFGLACISQALERNPQMTLADMILLTTQNNDEIIN